MRTIIVQSLPARVALPVFDGKTIKRQFAKCLPGHMTQQNLSPNERRRLNCRHVKQRRKKLDFGKEMTCFKKQSADSLKKKVIDKSKIYVYTINSLFKYHLA